MIKLIASDLDGTLLQNGAQELTPRAVQLIHRLTQAGIRFAAASGRQYDNERRMFHEIEDEISYIAENGSLCIHQGKVIRRGVIPDELAERIIREIRKEPGFEIVVSREEACYIEDNNSAFTDLIVNQMKNTTRIVTDISQIKGSILKIAVGNTTTRDLRDYLQHLQEEFSSEIDVVTSGNIWIDFVVPGYNKGTALQSLLDCLHITPEECMAFGDQYNDVEMLQLAGISYAMENAAPGMKEYANRVTDSVEDVLESILEELDHFNSTTA